MTIKLLFVCSGCGNALEEVEEKNGELHEVQLKPCRTCSDAAWDQGYEDGCDDARHEESGEE